MLALELLVLLLLLVDGPPLALDVAGDADTSAGGGAGGAEGAAADVVDEDDDAAPGPREPRELPPRGLLVGGGGLPLFMYFKGLYAELATADADGDCGGDRCAAVACADPAPPPSPPPRFSLDA